MAHLCASVWACCVAVALVTAKRAVPWRMCASACTAATGTAATAVCKAATTATPAATPATPAGTATQATVAQA